MTINEAKTTLLLYRPGMADDDDPHLKEALALSKSNPELNRWLEEHWAAQEALRTKFKQITPPAALKEQIISEHAAAKRAALRQPTTLTLTAVMALIIAGFLAVFLFPRNAPPTDTLADYQTNMVSIAMRIYPMDLVTNNLAPIRAYLAQQQSPSTFALPARLQKAPVTGCTVEHWQSSKVSLVCFRTGKPLPPGSDSDLWLFVMDRSALKTAPDSPVPQYLKINKLITATWSQGDHVYLLEVEGDENDLKQYL